MFKKNHNLILNEYINCLKILIIEVVKVNKIKILMVQIINRWINKFRVKIIEKNYN
jgi:hypothetical protein